MTTLEENSGPVTDPTTDFNIFDPEFVRDPYPTMSEIRESKCPIAHTNRWGGSWLPTRYEDVVAIAQEHEIFTSREIIVTPRPVGQIEGPYAGVAAPPITSVPMGMPVGQGPTPAWVLCAKAPFMPSPSTPGTLALPPAWSPTAMRGSSTATVMPSKACTPVATTCIPSWVACTRPPASPLGPA